MALYMTKVWGFTTPAAPLRFGDSGRRESARQVLRPGDLVVLVGTKGSETSDREKGKVLGLLEPTTEVANSLDFDLQTRDRDFEGGNYRWPYALLIRRAWKFDEPYHEFEEFSLRRFNMDAASGIVNLTDDEAGRILRLPRREVEILSSVRTLARLEGEEQARRKGAPPPTSTRRGVMHMRRAPAYTYAMAIRGGGLVKAFKIGWAFDYRVRQRTFNLAAMPELGGLRYEVCLNELWDTAQQAFRMEQALLRRFDSRRHRSNQEIKQARDDELQKAWVDYLMERKRTG